MPIPWNDDTALDAPLIRANADAVIRDAIGHARERSAPTVTLAQVWHRRLYHNCTLPVAYYAGEVRDSDPNFPELFNYEVAVGRYFGARAAEVPDRLVRFEQAFQQAVAQLDPLIPQRTKPSTTQQLLSVLELAATTHGEWIRIHPFANGNGRTARLWANWSLARYGLPAVVRLKPRPSGDGYAIAAQRSMAGDDRPMQGVINSLVQARIAF